MNNWKTHPIYSKSTLLTDKIMEQVNQEVTFLPTSTPLRDRGINWTIVLQHVSLITNKKIKQLICAHYLSLFELEDYPIHIRQDGELAFYPRSYNTTLLSTFPLHYIYSLPRDQQRQYLVDIGITLKDAKNKFGPIFTGQDSITLSLSDDDEEEDNVIVVD